MPSHLKTVGFVPEGPLTSAVRSEIERRTAELVPPGKTSALLVLLDKNGVSSVLVHKINNNWTLDAEVKVKWGGDVTGSVVLNGSW